MQESCKGARCCASSGATGSSLMKQVNPPIQPGQEKRARIRSKAGDASETELRGVWQAPSKGPKQACGLARAHPKLSSRVCWRPKWDPSKAQRGLCELPRACHEVQWTPKEAQGGLSGSPGPNKGPKMSQKGSQNEAILKRFCDVLFKTPLRPTWGPRSLPKWIEK